MKIILKEIEDNQSKIVWHGDFSPSNEDDENAILEEAFNIALCNYILMLYPGGLGLNYMAIQKNEDGILMRKYHCSGRNVHITYKEGGIELHDNSTKDRDYILEVSQKEEVGK